MLIKEVNGRILASLLRGSHNPKMEEIGQQIKTNFNFDYNSPPAWIDYEQFLKILEALRQALFPFEDKNKAYTEMGKYVMQEHFVGVGKVNRIAAKLLGAEKSVEVFSQQRNINLPFAQHKFEMISSKQLCYTCTGLITPIAFEISLIKTWFEAAQAKNLEVTCNSINENTRIFYISWD